MDIKEVVEAGRITVDIGVRAYQESGIEPGRGSYYHCGIGAVAVACGISPFQMGDCLGEYARCFVRGFDGKPRHWSYTVVGLLGSEGRERRRGYEDGRRLWEAVKDGVPPVEAGEVLSEIQEERELVLA